VLNATAAAPGIFTYASNAVAQDTGYNLIGPANPAKPGGAIIVYLTGSGPVDPPAADGAAAPSSSLSRVQSPVTATVGTTPAQVLFAGLSPGFAGLLQVDLIVPSSLAAGTYPVTIFISGEASNSPNLVVGP
jgi:uncharacterized protein (TIGR03437 family)